MDHSKYVSSAESLAMCKDPWVVRTPTSAETIRVFENPLLPQVNVIVLDGEFFLVGDLLCTLLKKKVRIVELAIAENDRGKRFLWPVRLGDSSATKALGAARKDCCVVSWSKERRRYSSQKAEQQFEIGEFPQESVDNLLLAAFGDRTIDDENDPRIAEILKTKSAA